MRSHPLPSRGGVRGGVCNISNILSAKSGGEEVSAKSGGEEWAAKKWLQRSGSKEVAAKKWQQRSGSKEVAAKKWQQRALLTLQTPPLPLPLKGGDGFALSYAVGKA